MINRRLIRVKVFKSLFSSVYSGSDSLLVAERALANSFKKSMELYFFLFDLPSAMKKVAEERIEIGLKKYQPTEEERNPNFKFVNSELIALLEEDEMIKQSCSKSGLCWRDHLSFVKNRYRELQEKEYFKEYMSLDKSSFQDDINLLITLYEELEECEELESIVEDGSLFWIDEVPHILNVIIKRLKRLKDVESKLIHPIPFTQSEDRDYGMRLLTDSLLHYAEYKELLSTYLLNWEPDRLASTDIALMVLGVSEAISFPQIPLKVTINEYVELSKYYSTPKSRLFVNGVLDKVLYQLQEEGRIVKSGRGLVQSSD